MSKFVIECPNCGKYAEARTGFFARKKIDCACGYTINVRTDKLTGRECPHCGNMVVFDQSKGEKAKCPVCGEPINTMAEQDKMAEFSCGQCGVRLRTSKSAEKYVCPVCDFENFIPERLMSEQIKKDGLASIIKYEGDNDTLIWKHPIEDFNYGSQLIVHESQEAVFFRDGQALDLFGAGRYTLETQQLPLLEKLYKLPTDTEGTFHSEVYFINKTVQMAIKWGTPEKVRFIDPLSGVPLELGASGELNLAEAAMLAGVINSPYWYDPHNYLDYATRRRNTVLYQLMNHGYITKNEYNLAMAVNVEDTLIDPMSQRAGGRAYAYQSYIDSVIEEAEKLTGMDPYNVAMDIYTYMDPKVQQVMDDIQAGNYAEVVFPDDLMISKR